MGWWWSMKGFRLKREWYLQKATEEGQIAAGWMRMPHMETLESFPVAKYSYECARLAGHFARLALRMPI